jgi:hypothetical protein
MVSALAELVEARSFMKNEQYPLDRLGARSLIDN